MMQDWFLDAKLGIFLHWGIYSVDGVPESWSFFNGEIPYDRYMAQRERFTAAKYDPDAWGDLFARAGARYAVLTTKHHDGFALWDTDANDLSATEASPAGRDLIAPYCEAMRRHGLKVGFYFSHLDWSHPDYASVFPTRDSVEQPDPGRYANRFAYPERGKEDPAAWARFLAFHRAQMEELSTRYGDVDLYWFDGEWERDPEQFDMAGLRDQLTAWQPNAVFNSRLLGHGDYATPEQGLPPIPPDGPWEFCMTVNDSWGYQTGDENHKSVRQIVWYLTQVVGGGGNLLLDVGPYEDGSLQPEQVARLEELGAWMAVHGSAVHGTRAGLPGGYAAGPSTRSKDGRELNLFVYDRPTDRIPVKGLMGRPRSATVLATGREVAFTVIGGLGETPGLLWLDWPSDEPLDPNASAIRLTYEEPFEVYTGRGRG